LDPERKELEKGRKRLEHKEGPNRLLEFTKTVSQDLHLYYPERRGLKGLEGSRGQEVI
jgi:hypothetical protein